MKEVDLGITPLDTPPVKPRMTEEELIQKIAIADDKIKTLQHDLNNALMAKNGLETLLKHRRDSDAL